MNSGFYNTILRSKHWLICSCAFLNQPLFSLILMTALHRVPLKASWKWWNLTQCRCQRQSDLYIHKVNRLCSQGVRGRGRHADIYYAFSSCFYSRYPVLLLHCSNLSKYWAFAEYRHRIDFNSYWGYYWNKSYDKNLRILSNRSVTTL